MTRKIILIANLSAKNFKNQSTEYAKIVSFLQNKKIKTKLFQTSSLDDLRQVLAVNLDEGYKELISLGGDGSLHNLVNELMRLNCDMSMIKIGVIPMGTGNDWLKNFNFQDQNEVLASVTNGVTKKVDLGRILFQDQSERYFVNIAGLGFNGAVIQNLGLFKFTGQWAYYLALIYSFFQYQSGKIEIRINEKIIDENCFILTIGIGKYAGGEMKLCPEALIDDGLFEVNLIRKISKWDLIKNIVHLKDGSYLRYIDCVSIRAKSIEIIKNKFLTSEADGEYLGRTVSRFEIIPMGLNVYG